MEAIKQPKRSINAILTTVMVLLMTVSGFAQKKQAVNTSSESIRPFEYHATQAQLDDLKNRIQSTKWPDKELVSDFTQGVPQATMKQLAKY